MVRPIEPLRTLDPLARTASAEQIGAVARRASDVGVQVQELSHFAVEGARRAGLLLVTERSPPRTSRKACADSGPASRPTAEPAALEGVLAWLLRCPLRRTHGQADVPGPLVRQLERLPHIEAERAESPGQVLEPPEHRPLHFDRGPLAEPVMAQVRLPGRGASGGAAGLGV